MRASVPFFPPGLFGEDKAIAIDIVRSVGAAAEQRFILGDAVVRLERRIAKDAGARHVIAVGSGTGALVVAVHALGIGSGDEVVVPAFSCQPVASAVANRGGTPVFADIDPVSMTLDPELTERVLTERTVAAMPAHVFSMMADMPAFLDMATRHGIRLIEDAAVAQGARLGGRPAGRWGDLGAFSFFQVKALGAIGEGGVILTDDDELADRCQALRNHGQRRRFVHDEIGYNSRMDEVLAEFLMHRISGLQRRLDRRADIAAFYTERFEPLRERELVPPPSGRDGRCYYVYAVLTDQRDQLRLHLADRGIDTHVYYPLPLPSQPAFARFGRGHRFPNAEAAGRRNLALPIWPELTDSDVEHVADSVLEFYR
ncbi:DegT/DnrJ/EryC1/StrS family aminotransferase [Nocardia anaemiae]|uniref:DegT/DnrJ/EryC1/StrS family aminotransferase n=1 Tax=Nocardia anaemiae TaxID=263910 RepID=UPI0007A42CC1|nr:DegT/DnrJ/EryC1/StrS family aminotransferase [Nocardia anaemiae]